VNGPLPKNLQDLWSNGPNPYCLLRKSAILLAEIPMSLGNSTVFAKKKKNRQPTASLLVGSMLLKLCSRKRWVSLSEISDEWIGENGKI